MAVVLLLKTENGPTIEFPVLRKCTLGRSRSCDLTVDDQKMSAKHGMFHFDDKGQLYYTDLESTNGSFLNNSKIQKIHFKINEILRLGNTSIMIDEKRLNAREAMAIGRAQAFNEDRTIIMPADQETRASKGSIDDSMGEEGASENQKKSVILNKDLKNKISKSEWGGIKKENLIDQEKRSGTTKILKLDINKHKKKN